MKRTEKAGFIALVLALASILALRVFSAFVLSEALAVAAFVSGAAILILHRRGADAGNFGWPQRLIVTGSLIGLGGLALKLAFVLLGVGAGAHDMAAHQSGLGDRLLQHIHHLFFNIGFLFMLIAAVWLLVGRLRAR